jgi:hypothetical protein
MNNNKKKENLKKAVINILREIKSFPDSTEHKEEESRARE